jgi:hypothetical protein
MYLGQRRNAADAEMAADAVVQRPDLSMDRPHAREGHGQGGNLRFDQIEPLTNG